MGSAPKAAPERKNEGYSTLIKTLGFGDRKRAAASKNSRPKGNMKQDNLQFRCPKSVDISGFFKKFCIATRTNKTVTPLGLPFFYARGNSV